MEAGLTEGRRGVHALLVAAVTSLVTHVAYDVYHALFVEPLSGDALMESLTRMAVVSFGVSLVVVGIRIYGLVRLARLPDMQTAVAAIVLTVVAALGPTLAGFLFPFGAVYDVARGLLHFVAFAASAFVIVTLTRTAEQLRGRFSSSVAATFYVILGLQLVLNLIRNVQLYFYRAGEFRESYGATRPWLTRGATVLSYVYVILFIIALVGLYRSLREAETRSPE